MRSLSWPVLATLIFGYAALSTAALAVIGNPYRASLRSVLLRGYDEAEGAIGKATFDAARESEAANAAAAQGKALIRQGDLPGADAAFRDALRGYERIAARDPANSSVQRQIFVSRMALGLLAETTDRLSDARQHYRAAIATLAPIAQREPQNPGWQSDIASAQERLDALDAGEALNRPN